MRLVAVFAVISFAALILTGNNAEARGYSTSTSCLPGSLKSRLSQIRSKFGPIKIISTYRQGARIKGNGRLSKHAACKAVDFKVSNKQRVYAWLNKVHRGGLGLYYGNCSHIHIDSGIKLRWIRRGC